MRSLNRLPALRILGPRYARPHPRFFHSSTLNLSPVPIPIPIPTTPAPSIPTPSLNSPLPITPQCPTPSCPCEPTPKDLDIDRVTPLAGTMANYYRHLLISTGKSDWTSKIEFDPPTQPGEPGGLAAKVKSISSQKGSNLRDPFAPTLLTNSSFPSEGEEPSAYVFPSGLYIPRIPTTTEAVTKLIREFLLPPDMFTTVSDETLFEDMRRVRETVVLICSHTSRDTRCGVLAPPLKAQFENILGKRGMLLTEEDEARGMYEGKVKVGFTSHLSGHKFAGNVIVYLPPGESGVGLGVWYGRVEPIHVEGIVDETVLGRRVVGELCRGVVGGGGDEEEI